jgi:hypothetical protein
VTAQPLCRLAEMPLIRDREKLEEMPQQSKVDH